MTWGGPAADATVARYGSEDFWKPEFQTPQPTLWFELFAQLRVISRRELRARQDARPKHRIEWFRLFKPGGGRTQSGDHASGIADPDQYPSGGRAAISVDPRRGPFEWHRRQSDSDHCSIGSHPLNDFVIDDPTVSRFHCEIRIAADGVRVRDLNSLNGTIVDGVGVTEAFVRGGSLLRLGKAVVRFDFT